jgi:hypothetical protein
MVDSMIKFLFFKKKRCRGYIKNVKTSFLKLNTLYTYIF